MRRTKLFRPGQGPEVSRLGGLGRQAGTTKIGYQEVDPCCTCDAGWELDCEQG